jgi:APA family basic amino acid/polyamine antiporter
LLKTKRELGLFAAVMMGLSGSIGFEIFVLLDYAYLNLAGSSIILALLLAGLINLLTMLSYCELGAAIPKVGGEYTYIKAAYGGFIAFISGCFRWLASVFAAALAAVCFTQQLQYLFSMIASPVQVFISTQTPLIAVIVVIVLATLDIRGVKKLGATIVVAFIAIFAVFIASGLLRGATPIEVLPEHPLEGLPRVFAATVYTFPMFFGMRALVAGASLIKNPGKNVPKGILLSALLIIPLYVSFAYIAVGVVPLGDYDRPFINVAAENLMPGVGGALFAIAGMVASLSALGTSLAVQSSIARGMSRDRYLPKILLSIHRRFGTPYVAILTGSLFVMLLSAIEAVEFLGYAASFGSLLVFALVNLSLLRLRKNKPYIERPFKTPLYPFTPIAGAVMSIALLVFPMLLGDVNASAALISSIGLTVLVLTIYYLKMIGRYRLQVAVGGVCFVIGVSLALLTFLSEAGFMAPVLPYIPGYLTLFISVISIITGILNAVVRG